MSFQSLSLYYLMAHSQLGNITYIYYLLPYMHTPPQVKTHKRQPTINLIMDCINWCDAYLLISHDEWQIQQANLYNEHSIQSLVPHFSNEFSPQFSTHRLSTRLTTCRQTSAIRYTRSSLIDHVEVGIMLATKNT